MNQKEEEIAKQCGQFLINFVTAETPDEAYRGLISSIRESFKFRIPGPRNKPILPKVYPDIEISRDRVKSLFLDLIKGISLRESEAYKFYEYCYEETRSVRVEYHDDDSITETPLLMGISEINDYPISKLDTILAYCIINCLKSNRSRRLIRKCEEDHDCGKYYIAERDKKGKGKHRFCSDKCRNRFHYLQKKKLSVKD
jgi:hypothetical protein